MIIDCDTCVMRDLACGDCVVSVLLGPPGALGPGFDEEERAALDAAAARAPALCLTGLPDAGRTRRPTCTTLSGFAWAK